MVLPGKVVAQSDTHALFITVGALEGESDITSLDRPVREEQGLQLWHPDFVTLHLWPHPHHLSPSGPVNFMSFLPHCRAFMLFLLPGTFWPLIPTSSHYTLDGVFSVLIPWVRYFSSVFS